MNLVRPVVALVCLLSLWPVAGGAEVRLTLRDGDDAPAAAVQAAEVHAVGVYEGAVRTGEQIHGPVVRVSVDRPGATVVLLLGSYRPVRWQVEVTPATRLERVVLHGYRPGESDVVFSGAEPAPAVSIAVGLPLSYQAAGKDMRDLLDRLPEIAGTDRLASFHGDYTAPEEGFFIAPDTRPVASHDPDYLQERSVAAGSLPQPLRYVLERPLPSEPDVRFTEKGFLLRNATGGQPDLIPISLDVPPVSWPVAAARDPSTGVIYGVSLGGEGFLYAHDGRTGQWRVESSMKQADASGLIFDQGEGRLVIVVSGLVTTRGPALYFYGRDGTKARTDLSYDAFPGLADLYDPGNGPEAALVPLAVGGGKLLVKGEPRLPVARLPREDARERLYVIDMKSGKVDLVRREGPGFGATPEPW